MLKNDEFPSSAAFDRISSYLISDENARRKAIGQVGAVVVFTLINDSGTEESWYIDLKNTGTVGLGTSPDSGAKVDATMVISEADFGQLVEGKANAQKLFMAGKLKIKGNVMKAVKMEPLLRNARTANAKL